MPRRRVLIVLVSLLLLSAPARPELCVSLDVAAALSRLSAANSDERNAAERELAQFLVSSDAPLLANAASIDGMRRPASTLGRAESCLSGRKGMCCNPKPQGSRARSNLPPRSRSWPPFVPCSPSISRAATWPNCRFSSSIPATRRIASFSGSGSAGERRARASKSGSPISSGRAGARAAR